MAVTPQDAVKTLVGRFASRLIFPQLFAFTATLFLVDLFIPDLIPFIDEILLGLATLLLGTWKREPEEEIPADKPPIKDITPRDD